MDSWSQLNNEYHFCSWFMNILSITNRHVFIYLFYYLTWLIIINSFCYFFSGRFIFNNLNKFLRCVRRWEGIRVCTYLFNVRLKNTLIRLLRGYGHPQCKTTSCISYLNPLGNLVTKLKSVYINVQSILFLSKQTCERSRKYCMHHCTSCDICQLSYHAKWNPA